MTYIIGRDSASRVTRDKLDLHINLSIEIFIFGLEARARGLVKRESKKFPVVENLSAPIAPRNLKILVEVASRGSHETANHEGN